MAEAECDSEEARLRFLDVSFSNRTALHIKVTRVSFGAELIIKSRQI